MNPIILATPLVITHFCWLCLGDAARAADGSLFCIETHGAHGADPGALLP